MNVWLAGEWWDDVRVFDPEQIWRLQKATSPEEIRRIHQELLIPQVDDIFVDETAPVDDWVVPTEIITPEEMMVPVEVLDSVESPQAVQEIWMKLQQRFARVFRSTPDVTEAEKCKQAFQDHQGIAFNVLDENFWSALTHGQYEKYNISNIFRDLLEAYRNVWHVSRTIKENTNNEKEAIEYCLSNKLYPTYDNQANGAMIRGYKKDSLSFREVVIDMNVLICIWLIRDLDELIWKQGIDGYYEIWQHWTQSDPSNNTVSVRFFFYSKWNTTDEERRNEDEILRKIGLVADRHIRGFVPFWDIINMSGSAWSYLTPAEFTPAEESQFFQIIKNIWDAPLLGVIKAFLTTEETSVRGGSIGSKFITKLDRKSFHYIKKVFEDFGIDITYKKDKWFVFHPISQ